MSKRWIALSLTLALLAAIPPLPANAAAGELADDLYYKYGFQWNLDFMDIGPLWALQDAQGRKLTGRDVTVAVLDTGLSAHEDLPADRILAGYNAIDEGGSTDDTDGHGTFVAGIIAAQAGNAIGIAGVACEATILPCVVVSGDKLATRDADVATAIQWAVDEGADVINLSLGDRSANPALKEAIDYAVERGVIVVAAVGNDGNEALLYPAAYDNVIGVGAVDKDGSRASYSNLNASVWVTAPGTQMCSLAVTAQGGSGYDYRSGTSFAAPCVSGLAALVKQYDPDITTDEFKELLRLSADDRGDEGYDQEYGYGSVNAARLAGLLSPTEEPTVEPTTEPTVEPTAAPTTGPTVQPTETPTAEPSETPSASPSAEPTETPSASPSAGPSETPSESPSAEPSETPSESPSAEPSETPSESPSAEPSETPSASPSAEPSETPSESPSAQPSAEPSPSPSPTSSRPGSSHVTYRPVQPAPAPSASPPAATPDPAAWGDVSTPWVRDPIALSASRNLAALLWYWPGRSPAGILQCFIALLTQAQPR